MADKTKNEIITRFQNMFGFGVKNIKQGQNISDALYPVRKVDKGVLDKKLDTDEKYTLEKLPFDENTKQLFNYWLSNCHDDAKSWEDRKALWQDMDILYFNSAIISKSIELIADEVLQADSNDQLIFVDGKKKIKNFIYEFFNNVNIYDLLRPTIIDIVQYGNAGWILGFDKKGVSEVIPIDIYSFQERMEFTPFEVDQKMKDDKMFRKYSNFDMVQQLIDSITNKENITSYFKKYLFGFQIGDTIIPPWKFIHFRNMTNKSPFAPYGIPAFIHSMAAYRQYDAAMGMQITARGVRFPKSVYKLDIPMQVDPVTKLNKAIEFLNELTNSGLGQAKKETPGIGDIIVTIKDLYEFEQQVADIDLGKIDDILALKDDIINSTFIPRYLLDPNDSGFGDSGISVVEKSKPFARQVYRFQSILLQNLTQLVKIHAIYSQQFTEDELDFTLSMKYPESQTSSDLVSSQSSLLDLANNVIQAIQDKVTGGEPIPPELVKSIYTQFLPYDQQKIESWIDDAIKHKEDSDIEMEQNSDNAENNVDNFDIGDSTDSEESNTSTTDLNSDPSKIEDKLSQMDSLLGENRKKKASYKGWKLLEKEVGKVKLKEEIDNIIFQEKQNVLKEYTLKKRHIFSSRNKNIDFPTEKLYEFTKSKLKKLSEDLKEDSDLNCLNQEVRTYEFKKNSKKKKTNNLF